MDHITFLQETKYPIQSNFSPPSYYHIPTEKTCIHDTNRIRALLCENSVNSILEEIGFVRTLPNKGTYNWVINKWNNVEMKKGITGTLREFDNLGFINNQLYCIEVKAGRFGSINYSKLFTGLEKVESEYKQTPKQLIFAPIHKARKSDIDKFEMYGTSDTILIDTKWETEYIDRKLSDFFEYQGILCNID